jgi:hypothetical protein
MIITNRMMWLIPALTTGMTAEVKPVAENPMVRLVAENPMSMSNGG